MKLLEMGFSASVIILVIIICRALLINKLPKKVFLALWAVALVRLIIPYSLPSVISIYSLADQNRFIIEKAENIISSGKKAGEGTKIENIKEKNKETPEIKNNITKKVTEGKSFSIWKFIWAAGFLICAAAFIIAYILCYKKFCTSLPVSNNFTKEWLKSHKTIRTISIRQSGFVKSPISYGIFKPVILMPKKTDWNNLNKIPYILEHEFVHIKRLDALAKLFLIIAFCIHWFNPLVWAMYILVNRDIELACDETVVKHFGENSKSAYALVLIGMEEEKNNIAPLGNNFNKNAAEERIIAIMNIKKTPLSVYAGAILLFTVIVSVFATSAKGSKRSISLKTSATITKNTRQNKDTKENEIIKDKETKENKDTSNGEDIMHKPEEEGFSGNYNSVLGEIAAGIAAKGDYQALAGLASFVNKDDLNKIAMQITEKGNYGAIIDLAPFLSKDVINKIAQIMAEEEAYTELTRIAPFMQETDLPYGIH